MVWSHSKELLTIISFGDYFILFDGIVLIGLLDISFHIYFLFLNKMKKQQKEEQKRLNERKKQVWH